MVDFSTILNKENERKRDRLKKFDDAAKSHMQKDEAQIQANIGVARLSLEETLNTLKTQNHGTLDSTDFDDANKAITDWHALATESTDDKRLITGYDARKEYYEEIVQNKKNNNDSYNEKVDNIKKIETSLDSLVGTATNNLKFDFTAANKFLNDYETGLQSIYEYIDENSPEAERLQGIEKSFSKWVDTGLAIKGYDVDADTEGLQLDEKFKGNTFEDNMQGALYAWSTGLGGTGSANQAIEQAFTALQSEQKIIDRYTAQLKEKRIKGLTNNIPLKYNNTAMIDMILNESELAKNPNYAGPQYRFNQDELEMIGLLSRDEAPSIRTALEEQRNSVIIQSKLNLESAANTLFEKLDRSFGKGVAGGFPITTEGIDPGLKQLKLTNVQPASSAKGSLSDNSLARKELKKQLGNNIIKIFKHLESGFGNFINDDFYDPKNQLRALVDGKTADGKKLDLNSELGLQTMASVARTYIDDIDAARAATQEEFGSSGIFSGVESEERASFDFLMEYIELYDALQAMDNFETRTGQ